MGLVVGPGAPVSSPAPTAATPSVPTERAGDFELAWEDDFDAFDASRWQLMTHSWDTNLAQFSTENVSFDNGILSLLLTPEPADAVKPFRGVEMRSIATERYGRIEARARLARGSGVVSSLVTIYTPWPADNWNELDIEFLGRYSDRVQFNAMVYTGPPTQAPVQESVTPTQFPELSNLDFDPSGDFHVYGIEWTPVDARFSIDGTVRHVWNTDIARLDLPMNILLTIWASSAADWAGALPAPPVSTSADYDWIRVYRWTGAAL
jgi:endo-1,3-1,4-beta-glycanase ExoK